MVWIAYQANFDEFLAAIGFEVEPENRTWFDQYLDILLTGGRTITLQAVGSDHFTSRLAGLWLLWKCGMNAGTQGTFISHYFQDAKAIQHSLRPFAVRNRDTLLPWLTRSTANDLIFKTDSRISFRTAEVGSIRGHTIDYAVFEQPSARANYGDFDVSLKQQTRKTIVYIDQAW